jgi:hypothetical protein
MLGTYCCVKENSQWSEEERENDMYERRASLILHR